MTDEVFDWDAFLRDSGEEGPTELAADERLKARALQADAADLYDEDTQAFVFLLAALVHRAGGAVAFTREERTIEYRLGIDQSELDTTGILRLFSVVPEEA